MTWAMLRHTNTHKNTYTYNGITNGHESRLVMHSAQYTKSEEKNKLKTKIGYIIH